MTDPPVPPADPAPSLGRAVAVYTALRFGLLVGLVAVLLLAGVPPLPAAVLGLAGSLVGSLVLLRRQRDVMALALVARRERAAARRDHEQRVREHVAEVRRAGVPGPGTPGEPGTPGGEGPAAPGPGAPGR